MAAVLKDITLGQYFPGNTVVHRLDPRTKIIMVVFYIISLFSAKTYVSYCFMAIVLFTVIKLSKIPGKTLIKSVKPLVIFIGITGVLNMFYTPGQELLRFWIFKITKEGIIKGILMVSRIIMLVMGTFMLTYTTSPIMLTDGLESLLAPLKVIKVPVHELTMIMSIALRFVPTLIEETEKIMNAQKARGAEFDTGGLIAKAKALLPVLVPLFISAFRRADELAVAMESRCYHGGEGRTKLKRLKLMARDYGALCCGVLVMTTIFVLRSRGL